MKFLYIVSSPHGGSTLVSLLLGRHPAAASLGEVSFIPKLIALNELCTCGQPVRTCNVWGGVYDTIAQRHGTDLRKSPYGFSLGDAIKDRFGSGLVDMQYQTATRMRLAKARGAIDTFALMSAPSRSILAALTPPSVKQGIRNTLAFYEAAAESMQRKLVIDASKLPRKAPRLFLECPDRVRILHLVRDGRGVLASRLRYMSAGRAVRRWNHYHRLTCHLLERWVEPASFRRLRYEDIVAEPKQQLQSLCEWLDLEYSEDMLNPVLSPDEHSAGGNPARFRLAEGIRPDDRWRTQLDAGHLRLFEQVAGPLNRKLGYG